MWNRNSQDSSSENDQAGATGAPAELSMEEMEAASGGWINVHLVVMDLVAVLIG